MKKKTVFIIYLQQLFILQLSKQKSIEKILYIYPNEVIFKIFLVNTLKTLSADPQLLWTLSKEESIGVIPLWLPTPKKLLKASVVFFTLTFKEPIRRNPKSFSENENVSEFWTSKINIQGTKLTWHLFVYLQFWKNKFILIMKGSKTIISCTYCAEISY